MATATRQTAEERRSSILDAALIEFAAKGLHGTSTEDIAKRAGISQPYVFRLFGTKQNLFAEACGRCMREVRDAMAAAAAGKSGCCHYNKGVCGCQDGKPQCCDGKVSASCRCGGVTTRQISIPSPGRSRSLNCLLRFSSNRYSLPSGRKRTL